MTNDLFKNIPIRPDIARQRAMQGRYDVLSNKVPVGQVSESKAKSSAQVDKVVSHESGSQPYCELKLDETRPYRIVVRFTQAEKETIGRQAKEARMPTSAYIRLTLLKLPSLDPERNQLLHKVNFELTKQGTNLNQIAKHMNVEKTSMEDGNSMLAIIARSLLSAHQSVKKALAADQVTP